MSPPLRTAPGSGRRPRTSPAPARNTLTAAARFLSWPGERGTALPACRQADAGDWLATGPGACYVRGFLTWAARHGHCQPLSIPGPQRHTGTTITDSQRWDLAARLLHDDSIDLTDRAAGCLVLLYGQPMTRIAALTTSQVTSHAEKGVTIRLGQHDIPVPQQLGELLLTLIADGKPYTGIGTPPDRKWLFPGLLPGRPITPARLAERLRALGIPARAGRRAALTDLAARLPAAVLADLLGLHPSTPVHGMHEAGADPRVVGLVAKIGDTSMTLARAQELRDAVEKLELNDAALSWEPETSQALGFGFRCGFLGLLHMEIIRERLEREFDLSLISTAPNVVYRVVRESGEELTVTNPSEFPDGKVAQIFEPVVRATVLAPAEYIGTIMELCQGRRGLLLGMDYLSADRVEIRYTMPLAEIIFDFFDQLKSRTRGYASLDYEPAGEQEANLVKVDILLQGQPVDAFSQIVHADKAREYGIAMTSKLRELIPRQQFEVPIQAAIGSRIIARENIRALRKDVLAKCYGGDITRKRKLLEKQKEGKRRMKTIGRVEVPQEAFIAALSTQPDKPR